MDDRVTISESELSSLYERYPEIKFEINEEPLIACSHFSSPSSNGTDGDSTQLSAESESTACTTPSRASKSHDGDAILDFLEGVQRANLPDSCRNGFSNLTKLVDNLSHLFPSSTDQHFELPHGLDNQEILLQSKALLDELQQVNLNVEEQVNNIAFVRGLAPFQVNPSEQDLWTNYRQKVQLIVQHTALPCQTERSLVEGWVQLFHDHVYHPFLEYVYPCNVGHDIEDRINELYDEAMSVLANYQMWCRGMMDIRQNHMVPARRAIRNSPRVLREIKEMEESKAAARAAINLTEAQGMHLATERFVQELNLSASRRKWTIPKKSKQRYRREYTV